MKAASSSLTFANQGRPRSSGACALAAFGRWSVVTAQPPCSVHGWVGQHKAGTCTQHPIALAGGGGSGCAGGGAATSLRADEATGGGRRAYDSDQLQTSRASSARLCRSSTRARAAAHIEAEPTKPRRRASRLLGRSAAHEPSFELQPVPLKQESKTAARFEAEASLCRSGTRARAATRIEAERTKPRRRASRLLGQSAAHEPSIERQPVPLKQESMSSSTN